MTSLSIRHLCVEREGARLLNLVGFEAKACEFIAVIGPNGAGKSTLLRTIAGLETPIAGDVLIDDESPRSMAPQARARALAFLPQAREVHWAVTAEAIVALGRFAYGAPRRLAEKDRAAVDAALRAVDAEKFRQRIMASLSGGEQARVHLARALAGETPLLLADEPTAALDPRHALAIAEVLAARARNGALVIAALHDLDLAMRYATRVIVLEHGRIVADAAPADLRKGVIEHVFKVRAKRVGKGDATLLLSPQNGAQEN